MWCAYAMATTLSILGLPYLQISILPFQEQIVAVPICSTEKSVVSNTTQIRDELSIQNI
jgi:hypothetical protein